MDDRQAFLNAVLDAPDDDGPRLVYADWLEERDDPYGEFIRVQCELAQLDRAAKKEVPKSELDPLFNFIELWQAGDVGDPRRLELDEREEQLLRAHGKEWIKPFRGMASRGLFCRGFLDQVRVTVPQLCKHGKVLFSLAPVRTVVVEWIDGQLGQLVACPHLRQVHTLNLFNNRIEDAGLKRLVASPNVDRLAGLSLGLNDIGTRGVRSLAASRHLGSLTELDLYGNQIGDEGLQILASAHSLGRLRVLRLISTGIGDAGVAALAASPHFPELATLVLSFNEIGDAGVEALGRSPYLGRLTRLEINNNRFDKRRGPARALRKRFGRGVIWHFKDRFG
jgi:uncharacterized protein (TIGR02996 family)